jgi:3-deoxy-D-manno-octulosonate 8-phosphate phosphatase (KDO 8-P phosphatase)
VRQISVSELKNYFSRVKLLALDVDGVLTDGGLYYTEKGEELKKFNVKDGMGLKLLMEVGVEVAIVTASQSASVSFRAQKLGINHVFCGVEDKLRVIEDLCQKLQLGLDEVAYVGDDINDLLLLETVGCPLTVADAVAVNKQIAIYVTTQPGGHGAVREICDHILSIKDIKPIGSSWVDALPEMLT